MTRYFDPYEKLEELLLKHCPQVPKEKIENECGFLLWYYNREKQADFAERLSTKDDPTAHTKSFFKDDQQREAVQQAFHQYIEDARHYCMARITEAIHKLSAQDIPTEEIYIPISWAQLILFYAIQVEDMRIRDPLTLFGKFVFGIRAEEAHPKVISAAMYGNRSVEIENVEFTDYEIELSKKLGRKNNPRWEEDIQ